MKSHVCWHVYGLLYRSDRCMPWRTGGEVYRTGGRCIGIGGGSIGVCHDHPSDSGVGAASVCLCAQLWLQDKTHWGGQSPHRGHELCVAPCRNYKQAIKCYGNALKLDKENNQVGPRKAACLSTCLACILLRWLSQ